MLLQLLQGVEAPTIIYTTTALSLLLSLIVTALIQTGNISTTRRKLRHLQPHGVSASNMTDQYDPKYNIPEDTVPDGPIRVKAIYIHPVKSCGPVEMHRALLTKTGFLYDRCFAFATETADATGLKWRFISQRTKPIMSQIKTELWLPHDKSNVHDPLVQAGGCVVLTFQDPEPPSPTRDNPAHLGPLIKTTNYPHRPPPTNPSTNIPLPNPPENLRHPQPRCPGPGPGYRPIHRSRPPQAKDLPRNPSNPTPHPSTLHTRHTHPHGSQPRSPQPHRHALHARLHRPATRPHQQPGLRARRIIPPPSREPAPQRAALPREPLDRRRASLRRRILETVSHSAASGRRTARGGHPHTVRGVSDVSVHDAECGPRQGGFRCG